MCAEERSFDRLNEQERSQLLAITPVSYTHLYIRDCGRITIRKFQEVKTHGNDNDTDDSGTGCRSGLCGSRTADLGRSGSGVGK